MLMALFLCGLRRGFDDEGEFLAFLAGILLLSTGKEVQMC